ncbi:hypothetical protein BGZ70_010468 [Mortierella alpina]|uniref:Uncharacterized protein n=1 Tax=Mortierella alpina TaxID=64518 RepID=A0A9P6M677_MORAP|nr:hypothetical protein BGZ70_010468 [Mortierella alpina]
MSSGQQASSPKALTSRDRDYLALIMAMTTEFRQMSTEWKANITKGVAALKSARTSVIRALADLTAVVDQLQEIATRMNRTRLKLIATIQRASPPGIMGIDAILKAQEEAREAAAIEKQRQEDDEAERDSDSDSDYEEKSHRSTEAEAEAEAETAETPTIYGYVPPPALVHHIIPGTQATPLAMSAYIQYVLDQILDEMALKEGILEALETMSQLKDSGEDDLPPLLDQQLTNLVLLWELEPYLETVPERNEVEAALGVVSWQMEKVK